MEKSSFDKYFDQFPARSFKKHAPLINAGDEFQKIYYLKKGYVRLYSISPEGKELTLIVYGPGEFFPLFIALTPPSPYPYWAEAMSPIELITVPVQSFTSFFKQNPEILFELAVRLLTRLSGALRSMENLAFGSAENRLCSVIIVLSQRFGIRQDEFMLVDAPFTHKDLANLAGLTRETVSAIMSELKKKGIIDYKNQRILIKSLPRLTKESLSQSRT